MVVVASALMDAINGEFSIVVSTIFKLIHFFFFVLIYLNGLLDYCSFSWRTNYLRIEKGVVSKKQSIMAYFEME